LGKFFEVHSQNAFQLEHISAIKITHIVHIQASSDLASDVGVKKQESVQNIYDSIEDAHSSFDSRNILNINCKRTTVHNTPNISGALRKFIKFMTSRQAESGGEHFRVLVVGSALNLAWSLVLGHLMHAKGLSMYETAVALRNHCPGFWLSKAQYQAVQMAMGQLGKERRRESN